MVQSHSQPNVWATLCPIYNIITSYLGTPYETTHLVFTGGLYFTWIMYYDMLKSYGAVILPFNVTTIPL